MEAEIDEQAEEANVNRWRQVMATPDVFHTFQSPVRYRVEVLESQATKAPGQKASWKQISG